MGCKDAQSEHLRDNSQGNRISHLDRQVGEVLGGVQGIQHCEAPGHIVGQLLGEEVIRYRVQPPACMM